MEQIKKALEELGFESPNFVKQYSTFSAIIRFYKNGTFDFFTYTSDEYGFIEYGVCLKENFTIEWLTEFDKLMNT